MAIILLIILALEVVWLVQALALKEGGHGLYGPLFEEYRKKQILSCSLFIGATVFAVLVAGLAGWAEVDALMWVGWVVFVAGAIVSAVIGSAAARIKKRKEHEVAAYLEERQRARQCPKCGASLSGDARFCNECGARVA